MGGCAKTSTHDVTARAPQSHCLKSKMGTASAATPTLSGRLMAGILVIVVRCCSTFQGKGTSQTKEQATRYTVRAGGALVLWQLMALS
jgi:hypothetical protein